MAKASVVLWGKNLAKPNLLPQMIWAGKGFPSQNWSCWFRPLEINVLNQFLFKNCNKQKKIHSFFCCDFCGWSGRVLYRCRGDCFLWTCTLLQVEKGCVFLPDHVPRPGTGFLCIKMCPCEEQGLISLCLLVVTAGNFAFGSFGPFLLFAV